jgi:hypothetical protein
MNLYLLGMFVLIIPICFHLLKPHPCVAAQKGQSTTVEQRQQEMLEMLTGISTDTKVPWRSAFQKYTSSLVKGVNVEESTTWFKDFLKNTPKAENVREGRGGDPKVLTPSATLYQWGPLMLNRAYYLLRDDPEFVQSGAAEVIRKYLVEDVLQRMRDNTRYYTLDEKAILNENKLINRYSDQLLLEQLAGSGRDEKRYERLKYLIHHWALDKATYGYTEYFSPHYTERDVIPLLNLYDFAEDSAIREWARMALDQFFAEFACVHINGFRGVANRRANNITSERFPCPELSDGRFDCLHPAGYIFFNGITDLLPLEYHNCDENLGYVYYATTKYRVPEVILKMANPAVRGVMEFRSARKFERDFPAKPDTFIYVYTTPDYVLSSIVIPEDCFWMKPEDPGSRHRAVPWRVSFRDPRAMISAKRFNDYHKYEGEPISLYGALDPGDSRALFQYKNVVFYKGTADTYTNLKPDVPAPGEGIDHEEADGNYRFYREAGTDSETVYVGVLEQKDVGIMEVQLASKYQSWDQFKQAFKRNSVRIGGMADIEYTACDGTHIEYEGHNEVKLNGKPYSIADWPLYESRLMNGDWLNQSEEAGILTIGDDKTGRLILNFRDSYNL